MKGFAQRAGFGKSCRRSERFLSPHPSPLPWGEGESFAASCEYQLLALRRNDRKTISQARYLLSWRSRLLCVILVTFFFAAAPVYAHIGNVNVFFDGKAGEYPVQVVIRPPKVVPGVAEISVRVGGDGVLRVSTLPVFWESGRKGAPPPDTAKLVPCETNLYASTLWLM